MSFPEPVVYAFRNHLPITRIGGDAAWVDSDVNRRRDRSATISEDVFEACLLFTTVWQNRKESWYISIC